MLFVVCRFHYFLLCITHISLVSFIRLFKMSFGLNHYDEKAKLADQRNSGFYLWYNMHLENEELGKLARLASLRVVPLLSNHCIAGT